MNGPKKEKKSFKQLSQKMATMTKIDMDKKLEPSQLNNGKAFFLIIIISLNLYLKKNLTK